LLFEPGNEPQLRHLDGDPESQLRRLRQGALSAISPVTPGWPRTEAVAALLGTWLKLIRYASQFEGLPAVDAESFLSRARAEYTALGREQAVAAFRGSRGRRFELQVMDVLFAAADLEPVLSQILRVRDFLPERIGDEPLIPWLDPLARELRGAASPGSLIAAVVVPTTPGRHPGVNVFTAGSPSGPNVTPWIPIGTGGIPGGDGGTCCPEAAPAPIVVALRGSGPEHVRLQDYSLQHLNVDARFQLRQPYGAKDRWWNCGVPALYSVEASTTMRIDPQYVREALGAVAEVEVALKHHDGREETPVAPGPTPEPLVPEWLTKDVRFDPGLGRIPV
jgi:hypothetical protein